MNDNADKKARELADHCRYCEMPDYRPCKADYEAQVEAIAAALREASLSGPMCTHDLIAIELKDARTEIAKLKADLLHSDSDCEQIRKELEQARKQLWQAQVTIERLHAEIKDLERELRLCEQGYDEN